MGNLRPEQRIARSRLIAALRLGVASTALVWASSTSMAATNLVANGSFESPVVYPANYILVFVGGSNLTNWSVVGPSGKNVAIIDKGYNLSDGAGINFAAADGDQWLDLTGGGSNSTEGVQQSVTLAPGAYTLSFYVGNVNAPSAGLGTQSTVDLWLNGSFVQSFTNSGPHDVAGINWKQYSHTFSGSGATSIEFRNADAANDHLNGLDGVFLAAVPEPSTVAMSMAGLLLLGVRLRRRVG